ncbi:PLD nuclease N-terminal domain-containing protein [Nesterenkonia sp.]|uniref:PLD nuclease N-terminal domain-containing protein n=1 Tax=Nesterenkonia sp. TaxID=704201 RepID=UPI0026328890|nr:PLD nuclease N-terminal domain-containing protein [Nesterenkonia sp.]
MIGAEVLLTALTLLAEQTPPGSVAVPWWLRFGLLVYGALLVAAFMVYVQTRHERPWNLLWVLIIVLVPILGAVAYFVAQTVRYRRNPPARPSPHR